MGIPLLNIGPSPGGPPNLPPPLPFYVQNPYQERLETGFQSGRLSSDEMVLLDRAAKSHQGLLTDLRQGGMTEEESAHAQAAQERYAALISRFEGSDAYLSTQNPEDVNALIAYDSRRSEAQLGSLSQGVRSDGIDLGEFQGLHSLVLENEKLRAEAAKDGFTEQERRFIAERRERLDQLMAQFQGSSGSQTGEVTEESQALYDTIKTPKGSGFGDMFAGMFGKVVPLSPDASADPALLQSAREAYGEAVDERGGEVYQAERRSVRLHKAEAQELSRIPANDTGLPSVSENQPPRTPLDPVLAREELSLLDKDGDGRLTREEVTVGIREQGITGERASIRAAMFARFGDLAVETKDALLISDFEQFENDRSYGSKYSIFDQAMSEVNRPEATRDTGLYGQSGQPEPDSLRQGRRGSCWLLAGMLGMKPEEVQEMIVPRDDGSFEVRLAGGAPEVVSPLTQAERLLYSSANGQWSAVIEKAVEQRLAREGKSLDGGNMAVGLEFLSGKSTATYDTSHGGTNETVADPGEMARILEQGLTSAEKVTAAYLSREEDNRLSGTMHVYNVVAYDPVSKMVTVHNPWGGGENADTDGNNDGVFQMTLSEFHASVHQISITQPQ